MNRVWIRVVTRDRGIGFQLLPACDSQFHRLEACATYFMNGPKPRRHRSRSGKELVYVVFVALRGIV